MTTTNTELLSIDVGPNVAVQDVIEQVERRINERGGETAADDIVALTIEVLWQKQRAAPAPAPAAVPSGWKLVPEEPTPEQYVRIVGGGITCEQAKAFYRAMVELAPPAPSASPAASTEALTTCVTCQGNGETVTDWERYLNARRGDVGDEAVTECPDCNGRGVSATPPAGEGREALIKAAETLLQAPDLADVPDEDKDPETVDAERQLRAALAAARREG